MAQQKIFCKNCRKKTLHGHLHNTAHGITGTHMAGTERYECLQCERAIFKHDTEAKKNKLKFVFD